MKHTVKFRLFQTTRYMPATGLLKFCELDKTCKITDRVNGYISRQQTSAVRHF